MNDFAPLDESQWVDEDEDGFGDNSSGMGGDQCPGVYGVENGEGGDGCPPPFVDADGDGIQDSDDNCSDTPIGVTVGDDGCEVDTDGDGVVDSLDQCPDTVGGINTVDDVGCLIIDDDDNGGGDDNQIKTQRCTTHGNAMRCDAMRCNAMRCDATQREQYSDVLSMPAPKMTPVCSIFHHCLVRGRVVDTGVPLNEFAYGGVA